MGARRGEIARSSCLVTDRGYLAGAGHQSKQCQITTGKVLRKKMKRKGVVAKCQGIESVNKVHARKIGAKLSVSFH